MAGKSTIKTKTKPPTPGKAEQRLTAELTQFIDTANAPIFGIDTSGQVNEWNQKAADLTGFSRDEVMGRILVADFIIDEFKDSVDQVLQLALQGKETASFEFPLFTKEGKRLEVLLNATTRRDIDNNITGVIGVGQDITEFREQQQTLQQVQKMEAVGQLTGGIAHDFSNLLHVIIGNLRLLKEDLEEQPVVVYEILDDAISAAVDGADLTAKLLSFSRSKMLVPVSVNLHDAITYFVRFLSRTLAESISLKTQLLPEQLFATVDKSQFDNALLNLVLNARDAMRNGGVITIKTSSYVYDQNSQDNLNLELGRYARITITDEGEGIPEAAITRIFEPFFTTKATGRGTGLGLSMVSGFAEQSGGLCRVDETSSNGTSISLFFPTSESKPRSSRKFDQSNTQLPLNHRTVLIVEDDPRVMAITVREIERLGYETVAVPNAEEAVKVLNEHSNIDLLFSDILMPGDMDGYQLAEWTQEAYPKLPIILCSGYTERDPKELQKEGMALLKKPYSRSELTEILNQTLY